MVPDLIFETNMQLRRRMADILDLTSEADLNRIPEGYRNNIWWNIVHMVVTQQLLCYNLSGVPMTVEKDIVKRYSKGSVPAGAPSQAETDKVRAYLLSSVAQLKSDYEQGIFKTYNAYTTSANVTLKSIEDALLFNLFHEGIHYGVVLSLQKAIGITKA
jgi:hypothetical protein